MLHRHLHWHYHYSELILSNKSETIKAIESLFNHLIKLSVLILINVSIIHRLKKSSIFDEFFPAKTIPLKVAENHQVWTGCFDSVLQLAVQGRIQETGQNYRREKYILNGENISMKLVGKHYLRVS